MIAPAIEERSATRWYEIRGWRGPQPALLRMPSPLLLGFARGIIADELRMLGPRLDELDRRLSPGKRGYAAVQKSKERPAFDLEVTEVPPPRRPRVAARLAEALAPRPQPASVPQLATTAGSWLGQRLAGGGRIVLVGCGL